MQFKKKTLAVAAAAACALGAGLTGCGGGGANFDQPKNIIFFLGDGMGLTTLTAARIYAVGEEGSLTIDNLPETAFIKTFSNDAQVTDSAPSMAAYMTGVKMNNEVISMTPNTVAIAPNLTTFTGNCGAANGSPVTTMLELAKARGLATGVVTTTRVTHATPAATYAHVCHRDAENDISAQLVPGGAGYNQALGDGINVILGGGSKHFLPTTVSGGTRADGRNLVTEMTAQGYTYVTKGSTLATVDAGKTDRLLGLFTGSHMAYDLDRTNGGLDQPSLSDMATKAFDIVSRNPKGYFLMVEGGRIDHALHETTAKKALQDTKAFDDAIASVMAKANAADPGLKNTLIVVTADHDHTLVLNGYAQRTGKTVDASKPGVLGLLRSFVDGSIAKDADGAPYTIIGFGNGENRVNDSGAAPAGGRSSLAGLTDATVFADTYHQEAAVQTAAGSETHGGTDVFLGAVGRGADAFHGTMLNTNVFQLIRNAVGL